MLRRESLIRRQSPSNWREVAKNDDQRLSLLSRYTHLVGRRRASDHRTHIHTHTRRGDCHHCNAALAIWKRKGKGARRRGDGLLTALSIKNVHTVLLICARAKSIEDARLDNAHQRATFHSLQLTAVNELCTLQIWMKAPRRISRCRTAGYSAMRKLQRRYLDCKAKFPRIKRTRARMFVPPRSIHCENVAGTIDGFGNSCANWLLQVATHPTPITQNPFRPQ